MNRAIQWLTNNQSSTGFFGAGQYDEHWTAAAAYALWLNNSSSSRANAGFSWLSSSISDSSSWYWNTAYGEADIPGAVLYSLSASNHAANAGVPTRLRAFQNSTTGGFKGYEDPNLNYAQVTSSVDTAFALLGLKESGSISHDQTRNATSYLFTLQNHDGSFNLTSTRSADSNYALGPDQIAITALTTLALGRVSLKSTDPNVGLALQFLVNHASSQDTSGHVYAASLSTLALDEFNRTGDANRMLGFIVSEQRSDGGFRDNSRGSSVSNALDTGWATIALEEVRPVSQTQQTATGQVLPSLFIVAVLAAVIIAGLSIFAFVVFRRRNVQLVTK